MRAKVITDGREVAALVGMGDYLRLNGGSFSPSGGFWQRLAAASRASAGAGDIHFERVPYGSMSGARPSSSRWGYFTPEEQERILSEGCDLYEVPEAVALTIERAARRLGVSAHSLIGLIVEHREEPESLNIRDVRRGISLAAKKKKEAKV